MVMSTQLYCSRSRYKATGTDACATKENEGGIRPSTVLDGLEMSYYQDGNMYIPVNIKDIRNGPFFGSEIYVKTFIGDDPRYILYYKGKDLFNSERREEFVRRNVDKLFVRKNGKGRYMQYVEANLREIIKDENEDKEKKAKVAYEVGMYMIHDILDGQVEHAGMERAMNWVFMMIDLILENGYVYSNLATILETDKSIFRHCVNTTVTGLIFARYTGLDVSSMNKLGIGLLLHDIGRIRHDVSDQTGRHVSGNNDNNSDNIMRHPLTGVSLLERIERFAPETLTLIRQHHENIDGTGYPGNLMDQDIHLFARYARIVDEYDLLLASEREKRSVNPHFNAVNQMVSLSKDKIDITLLTSFIRFLGLKGL